VDKPVDGNDLAVLNHAIQLALMGKKENAFDLIKVLAQKDANNMELILWGIYAAPNTERAELLLNRAKLINPNDLAIQQAEQWLTNEKFKWPHPPEGYNLFPPKIPISSTTQFYSQQIEMPAQPAPMLTQPQSFPVQQYYQAPPQVYIVPQPIFINNAPMYACPNCRSSLPPIINTRISTGGWVTFAILLVLFFPLCWVGLFSKTSYRYCGQCGIKFN
jgi:hypothetical protein